MTTHPDCIFCKIVAGQIPSRKAYEDDELLVFHDINPAAPVHLLVVPKEHFENLISAKPDHAALLGRMQLLAPRLAAENGAANGFRTVINNGPDGRQEVYHLHMHIMGGAHPWKRMG
ncbi:MAG: histidine triad nucleotide-binding protein [Candidatus Protistobacter heckmanni]|nr:histidine triad nucleotide-binding protein [Candidatus Protistobacter heckmanni]